MTVPGCPAVLNVPVVCLRGSGHCPKRRMLDKDRDLALAAERVAAALLHGSECMAPLAAAATQAVAAGCEEGEMSVYDYFAKSGL